MRSNCKAFSQLVIKGEGLLVGGAIPGLVVLGSIRLSKLVEAGQEAGADAEAMEGCSLLACLPWLAQPAFL